MRESSAIENGRRKSGVCFDYVGAAAEIQRSTPQYEYKPKSAGENGGESTFEGYFFTVFMIFAGLNPCK